MSNDTKCQIKINDTWHMPIYILLNNSKHYADSDARSILTRSYTLRSIPSSPGRSFLWSWWHTDDKLTFDFILRRAKSHASFSTTHPLSLSLSLLLLQVRLCTQSGWTTFSEMSILTWGGKNFAQWQWEATLHNGKGRQELCKLFAHIFVSNPP